MEDLDVNDYDPWAAAPTKLKMKWALGGMGVCIAIVAIILVGNSIQKHKAEKKSKAQSIYINKIEPVKLESVIEFDAQHSR